MATAANHIGISIVEWGAVLYRIKRGPLPVDCIGQYYEATVPAATELDLPGEDRNLTGDDVRRWFTKQTKRKIVFEPDPWEVWMD